jgi:hypothetical protein
MLLNLYLKNVVLNKKNVKQRKHNTISLYRNLVFPVKWYNNDIVKASKNKVAPQKQLSLLTVNFVYEKSNQFDPFNF